MNDEAAQLLQEARNLITSPAHWTQYAMARDAEGVQVEANDSLACSWCAWGAVHHIGMEDKWSADALCNAKKALKLAVARRYADNIMFVNDIKGHSAALACFDAAIKELSDG